MPESFRQKKTKILTPDILKSRLWPQATAYCLQFRPPVCRLVREKQYQGGFYKNLGQSNTEQKLQYTKIQKLIHKFDVSHTYCLKWTQPVWDMERSMIRIRVIKKRESRFRVSTWRAVSVSVVISQLYRHCHIHEVMVKWKELDFLLKTAQLLFSLLMFWFLGVCKFLLVRLTSVFMLFYNFYTDCISLVASYANGMVLHISYCLPFIFMLHVSTHSSLSCIVVQSGSFVYANLCLLPAALYSVLDVLVTTEKKSVKS